MKPLLQALALVCTSYAQGGGAVGIVPPLVRGWAVVALAGLLAVWIDPGAVLGVGHGPARASHATGQFSANVSLVEVYATVTDQAGRPVSGLAVSDFMIEEDGAPQAIQAFATGDASLSLAVTIDRSFSVTPAALRAAAAGARDMLDRLQPADQVMLIGIGGQTEVLAPLSTERASTRAALATLERWGTTPLFDSVVEAISAVQTGAGRRALILLSDGVDRYSRTSASAVVQFAREHDVLVYPVTIGRLRPAVWAEVAQVSGARSFHVTSPAAVTSTVREIVGELRQQYLLGYAPRPGGSRGWRSIRVRVNRPAVRVRARAGYLAPAP